MSKQKTNLPSFESVTSKPSKILNYGFGILMSISLLLVLGIFFCLLFFLPLEGSVLFICFFLILPAIILQVVYLKRTIKHTTTIIDNRGIHYINKFNNKVIKTISWNDFQKVEDFKGKITGISASSDADLLSCDVFSKMIGSGKYSNEAIFWFVFANNKVEAHKETFSGNHIFSMIYSNKLELAKGLLLGLAHFRPDLKVHPKTFSLYYINPDTYTIEYEKRREDINSAGFITALVIIITVFVLLVVFF